jgi:hypothetical protein
MTVKHFALIAGLILSFAAPAVADPGGNGNGNGNAYGYGFGNGGGRGGPLPLLGVSALGQLGAAAGGAYLIWRRRRNGKKS